MRTQSTVLPADMPAELKYPAPSPTLHEFVGRVSSSDKFIAYRSPRVIAAIQRDLGGLLNEQEAGELFVELLKYLYLKAIYADEVVCVPSEIIDHAWHCFILDMKEYEAFCLTHAGRLLYHDPSVTGIFILRDGLHRAKNGITQYFGRPSPYWDDVRPANCA